MVAINCQELCPLGIPEQECDGPVVFRLGNTYSPENFCRLAAAVVLDADPRAFRGLEVDNVVDVRSRQAAIAVIKERQNHPYADLPYAG